MCVISGSGVEPRESGFGLSVRDMMKVAGACPWDAMHYWFASLHDVIYACFFDVRLWPS